jgi:hypothetical protein
VRRGHANRPSGTCVLRVTEPEERVFDMILEPQEIVSGKNLSAKSSEIDFAIVLSRVIGSIENDPAQLRNAVYELARIKLRTELSQRGAPINVSEKGDLALALESAIDRVETVYSKHDHLRSLDRLTNSSEVDGSEITIEGRKSAPIIRPPSPTLLICPAFRVESWVTGGRPSPRGTAWVPHPWQGRPWSYDFRVAPLGEGSGMLMIKPENEDFVFPAGRYGLVIKGQAYDFTVAGPITEAAQCLEGIKAENGIFYSECRRPHEGQL